VSFVVGVVPLYIGWVVKADISPRAVTFATTEQVYFGVAVAA
jgi:hypothetical protein